MEKDSIGIFEIDEDSSEDSAKERVEPTQRLIDEPYSYDNVMENPIIKPIAEVDRSLRDLDEMIRKKLIDSIKDKKWVNETIGNVPEYSDSPFISKLIKLVQEIHDIIKFQDIEIKNLKGCIKEMVEINRQKYGVIVEEKGEEVLVEKVKTIIPEGSYINYLKKLAESKKENISEISKKVLEFFESDKTSKDDKIRFEDACMQYYKEEVDKTKKQILSKILRMEI
jgi:hypothetical protein